MDFTTFFFILFLHYLGDFPLQGQFLAENKGKDDYLLFSHAMIWAGTISVGLACMQIYSIWKVIFLILGHAVIDRWKARKAVSTRRDLMIDQTLHILQLIIVISL